MRYPVDKLTYSGFSGKHYAYMIKVMEHKEPATFSEAIMDKNWCKAMDEEMNALAKNSTWKLVALPDGKKSIGCKWVYKVKCKSDGTIERYKARLMAKGYA